MMKEKEIRNLLENLKLVTDNKIFENDVKVRKTMIETLKLVLEIKEVKK